MCQECQYLILQKLYLLLLLQKTTMISVTSPLIVMSSRLSVSQAVRFVCAHQDTASTPLRNHVSQVSVLKPVKQTKTKQ